ncbi:MAG: ATP-binding protein, partial [Anaerotignaceae bacterium]
KKNTTFIEAKHSIEDLILPKDQKQLILHGCNYIKLKNKVYEDWNFKKRFPYGKGLNMLFAGPPGTGKTMAAQIISKELSLPMYRLELSRTVSKYIGETEENLRIIFDAAQKSNIILFIDEMDALFGKRSEVKSSKDRYSNMETSYLLQRLEQYDGVVLMATNYLTNIDEAFMRRIHFIVHFPFPDQEARMYLWKTIFPPSAPLKKDIDFRFLSEKFELSGGSIKNIALKSAFLAAAQNKAISMTHIIPSVVDEMSKQGKIILKEDFAEFSYLVK